MEHSEEYANALIDAKKFHDNPMGFSKENTGSTQDQVIIRQNNVIIILLLRVLDKLDSIKTHISEKTPVNNELDSLIKNLKNTKINPIEKAKPKSYTFFAAKPKESKSETSNINDKKSQ